MAFLYTGGQLHNLFDRALSITLSPAVDANFPATGLYDGRRSRPCRHGSNAANPTITADLAAFTPGTAASYTITVRAGERRRVTSGGVSNVKVQNLSTGKYLTNAGAWQVASANCLTGAASLDYQVESLTLCQSPTVSLKITQSGAVTLSDWPRWNAIAVHGHNLDPGLTAELRSSTDNFAANNVLQATGAILQPSFWMQAAATVTSRYVRLALTGTNQATPWYAEVIPCYLETGGFGLGLDHELTIDEASLSSDSEFGDEIEYLLSPQPRRNLKLAFNVESTAERIVREEIVWRCRGRAYPLLAIPTSADTPAACFFGRLDKSWRVVRSFPTLWSTDLTLAEDYIAAPLS